MWAREDRAGRKRKDKKEIVLPKDTLQKSGKDLSGETEDV